MSNNSFKQENIKTSDSTITVSAPGKAILHGEHAVVYGRLAVCASVGLRTVLTIKEIDLGNMFIIQSPTLNFRYKFNLEKIQAALVEPLPLIVDPKDYNWENPGSLNHDELVKRVESLVDGFGVKFSSPAHVVAIKAIFYLCLAIIGSTRTELRPVDISTTTDLKTGAGLGSSASFSVCVAAALIQYVKKQMSMSNFSRDSYKPSYWETDLKKFNAKDLELICNWSFAAERIIHGLPSGLDNTTCTYGNMVKFRRGPIPTIDVINMPCSFRFLLINTHVPRATKKLLDIVYSYKQRFPDVIKNIFMGIDEISVDVLKNFEKLTENAGKDQSSEIYNNLGALATMNHSLLNALGVGHSKLDEIVEVLAQAGLHGKLTGAGGGGFAICMIPPKFDPVLLDKTIKELESRGFGVDNTELGGEGVKLEL